MPLIYDSINTDISRDLRFCFFNLTNHSEPNKQIKINDLISFDVVIFNPSETDINKVWLKISPGVSTSFEPIEVEINVIPKNSDTSVARIQTQVFKDPDDIEFFNSLAELSLNVLPSKN